MGGPTVPPLRVSVSVSSDEKMPRLGFSGGSTEVPFRSRMNQNRVPGTVVGGHAGDGGNIFSICAAIFSLFIP